MTRKLTDFHNALTLFENDILESYLLHIPHSSSYLPDSSRFTQSYVSDEINLLTDWKVDEIFAIKNTKKIIAHFSRIYCDVERLNDENEPMFQEGAGFYYTKTDDGKGLRDLDQKDKDHIYKNYYLKHQQLLYTISIETINKYGYVSIIDCHSFSSTPLKRELNQDLNRPDICLGVDTFHTPSDMVEEYRSFFKANGLSVAINMPYAGAMVPMKFYQKDKRARSIMIEINKKLYMDEKTLTFYPEKIEALRKMMQKLLLGKE